MTAKYSRRFLDLLINEFNSKTFSVALMPNVRGFVHQELHKGVSVHYTVPDTLCRAHVVNGKVTEPKFSAAAMMAIFDEISSFSCAMKDKQMRPGLSVHLSTELLCDIHPGDDLTILTCADKTGKTIGYASLEVLNKDGKLVARGKHIKYLPMGRYFDFVTHPIIAPVTLSLNEFLSKWKRERAEKQGKEHRIRGLEPIVGVGRVFDILGLTNFTGKLPHHHTTHKEEDTKLYCSTDGRADPAEVRSYAMTVKQITSNLNHNMHGGAVGCAVEHACLLSRSGYGQADGNAAHQQGQYNLDCYIKSLEVRYISSMKGDLVITSANDRHSPLLYGSTKVGAVVREAPTEEAKRWTTRSFGQVLNRKDGSLCAEYSCTWALHAN